MKADDPSGTAVDDPGGSAVGANVGDASPAAVSSLSAPTTSSSRVPPLNANGLSKRMSKLEALEESWHFSALHAELDVIFPPFHLRETMTCCGDECGCSVQLELSAQLGVWDLV